MFSERTITEIGSRIYLFNFCGASHMSWNKAEKKVVPANAYLQFNITYSTLGGFLFFLVHAIRLYLVLTPNEIPEENQLFPHQTRGLDKYTFVTTVLAWGELSAGIGFFVVNVTCIQHRDNIIYLYNTLFAYNQVIVDALREKHIDLDEAHKKDMRKMERVVLMTNLFSIVVAFLVVIALFHPLEPTHALIKDWLEIEWTLTLTLLPFIIFLGAACQSCGNCIVVVGILICCYCFLASSVLNDITVARMGKREGLKCSVNTRYYGVLEDTEIIRLYRIQRGLNERINEIFASALFAFHQVSLLSTLAIMLFFFVKFQQVIWEVGVVALLVVIGSMLAPVVIAYYQATFFGELVDVSKGFRQQGENRILRKMLLRRFLWSCQTFYVEEAYPFFHFHKDTFLAFCAQGLDYAITLMFW